MGRYSIKELERLSGIKAHTIRVWEKRYQVVEPKRTSTNIRYYSDDDLKKMLNMSILNNHGYKISEIANFTTKEIRHLVSTLTTDESDFGHLVNQMTLCMYDMDEVKFDKLLSSYIIRFGFEKTILEIVYPFLEKVGILWLCEDITPIQEHFITNLIRQKIIVGIDGLPLNTSHTATKVALFLPEHELHEIGLLFYHYLLKKLGCRTYYLGADVPLNDLRETVNSLRANHLVTCVTYSPQGGALEEFLALLSEKFHTSKIYISGNPLNFPGLKIPKNMHIFKNARDLKHIFQSELARL